MQCPECKSLIPFHAGQCATCGAKVGPRRVWLGAKRGDFSLSAEEESWEFGEETLHGSDFQFPYHGEAERDSTVNEKNGAGTAQIRWGGFFRRATAFCIDLAIILLLSVVLAFLCYVGYKIGLATHGRAVSWENSTELLMFLASGCSFLFGAYFVVFHGMEGKTIGKWLLCLRVVGVAQRPVTYRQSAVRCLGTVGFAPLVLGFLWILWSREKRGWHDLLARTWVIRDNE